MIEVKHQLRLHTLLSPVWSKAWSIVNSKSTWTQKKVWSWSTMYQTFYRNELFGHACTCLIFSCRGIDWEYRVEEEQVLAPTNTLFLFYVRGLFSLCVLHAFFYLFSKNVFFSNRPVLLSSQHILPLPKKTRVQRTCYPNQEDRIRKGVAMDAIQNSGRHKPCLSFGIGSELNLNNLFPCKHSYWYHKCYQQPCSGRFKGPVLTVVSNFCNNRKTADRWNNKNWASNWKLTR